MWLNTLSLIQFINHRGGVEEKRRIFYYERHEIRENINNTINPFHIRERNISTTGNTGLPAHGGE